MADKSHSNTVQQIMTAGLQSPAAREMMKLLEDMFYHGELFSHEPMKMAQLIGQRDVIAFMREFKPKEDHDG